MAAALQVLVAEKVPFSWTADASRFFEMLRRCLAGPPVLEFTDVEKPLVVFVDLGMVAVGASLMQNQGSGRPPQAVCKLFVVKGRKEV